MGALIAFELAHRLMRRGAPDPTALFVSGHAAPHLPRRRSDVHLLPPPQFLATLRELNGTPQELLEHPEILDLCLPRLRADWSVVETYEYQHRPPLNVEIDVFGGASDPEVSAAELYAWRQHGTKELQCRIMPGDHFFIYESGTQVFDSISRDLKRAIAGSLDRIQPHYS
jgi:surfactin synthase thioesterase subunit